MASVEPVASPNPPDPIDPGPPSTALGGGASLRWSLLYAVIAFIGIPLLLWRRFVLKKDLDGWGQKMGHVAERAPHGKRIWIHAVSVGEALATWTLYKEIKQQIPDADVVISTTTQTGQAVAQKRYDADIVFYYPLDFSGALKRAFDRVKPDLIVLMELEVWPNFTREALGRGVPVIVSNGRITEGSAASYKRAAWLLGPSFKRIRRWLMQNDEYAERVKTLGVDANRVEIFGNVKYDAVGTESVSAEEKKSVRDELGISDQAYLMVGGSTHPSEEDVLLSSYQKLIEAYGDREIRLILAPRHPQRLDEVEKSINAQGFICMRRTQLKEKGLQALAELSESDRARVVVLVDTMGELKKFFMAADVAFVGGSLIPHGGQNVMEPAGMGLPVVFGPHMHNFSDAVSILKECDGAVQVESAENVYPALQNLMESPDQALAMGKRAREAFLKKQGASARTAAYLKCLLSKKKIDVAS